MLNHAAWAQLRKFWIDLHEQFAYSETGAANYPLFLQLLDRTAAAYRVELDELVQVGKIRPPVTDNLLAIYLESAYHIWRTSWPATCYMTASPELESQFSRERLLKQAEILEEIAGNSAINPNTVKQVQDAMQKEISFLSQVKGISKDLNSRGYAHAQGWSENKDEGDSVQKGAEEAAGILVALLLGDHP